jgi:hypothetical protein
MIAVFVINNHRITFASFFLPKNPQKNNHIYAHHKKALIITYPQMLLL